MKKHSLYAAVTNCKVKPQEAELAVTRRVGILQKSTLRWEKEASHHFSKRTICACKAATRLSSVLVLTREQRLA
jgi:hypothetical protein